MRYKKLHNKSIPKKNLYKKSKSKIVGSKRIILYIPDSYEKKVTLDLLTTARKKITPKKSSFFDFIYKTDRRKLINYTLLLLAFTGIFSLITINSSKNIDLSNSTNVVEVVMMEESTISLPTQSTTSTIHSPVTSITTSTTLSPVTTTTLPLVRVTNLKEAQTQLKKLFIYQGEIDGVNGAFTKLAF